MPETRKFIILTSPRTGSTYLRLWLNNHSRIHCHGEVFFVKYFHNDGFYHYCAGTMIGRVVHVLYRYRIMRKLGLRMKQDAIVSGFLQRLSEDPTFPAPWMQYDVGAGKENRANKPVIGFKLMYNQLKATPELQRWLVRKKCSILHLFRENNLKRFVSLKRMKKNKIFHAVETKQDFQPVEIPIDKMIKFFRRSIREVQIHRNIYAGINPYYELSYESFFNDMATSRKEILSFLGLQDEKMEGARLKKTSSNLIEREIANYREVIAALSGTEFEGYLDAYQY